MATSAKCIYAAVQTAGVFNYEVRLKNTSPAPFDLSSFMFGWQFNVFMLAFPLDNVMAVQSPPGWVGYADTLGLHWGADYQGSPVSSGYILPGQTGTFLFQSVTPPPPQLPFGCFFFNSANAKWGFGFNGTALLGNPNDLGNSIPIQVVVPPPTFNPWWWIETLGGLVPPGPTPWMREIAGALSLAATSRAVSPKFRADVLELTLEQLSIASGAIKKEIKALQKG
jgi:hypothetical protein